MMNQYLFTAISYYAIGAVILWVSAAILLSHPVNRVFIFGQYLTPDGVRVVIQHWPLVSLFGLFIFGCAVEHHLHWYYDRGHRGAGTMLAFMGWIEAGISVITALAVVFIAIRRGVRRWLKT